MRVGAFAVDKPRLPGDFCDGLDFRRREQIGDLEKHRFSRPFESS
jgi:hypothetical protein